MNARIERTAATALASVALTLAVVAATPPAEPIFEGDATPKQVLSSGAGEGPAWHPELGLLFSGGDGHLRRLGRDGQVRIHREKAHTNGLLFDAQGRLLACEPGLRRVTRTEKDGTLAVLAADYQGKKFNQPNDLAIDSQGRIYFTDPRYGDRGDMQIRDAAGRAIEGVYRIDPDGKVAMIVAHEVDRPNGIDVSPDDKSLFVADNNNNDVGGARILWRFDLRPDGTIDPASRRKIHDWKTGRGPDGLVRDAAGRLYVAAGLNKPHFPAETVDDGNRAGVYVFSPSGELLQHVPIGRDEVTNCTFGDDDLRTLYVTAGGTLWTLRTTTPGLLPFPKGK